MRASRFNEEQFIAILREQEAGARARRKCPASTRGEQPGGSAPHPVAPPSPTGLNAEQTLLIAG